MRVKPSVAIGIGALLGAAAWFGYQTRETDSVEIIFLSVGQGDCIVIRDGDKTALIDAGPSAGDYDAGERLIAPKLRKMGIDRIDLVLLSHPDADHIGGLSGIAKRLPIGRAVYASHFAGSKSLEDELKEAKIGPEHAVAIADSSTIYLNQTTIQIRLPKWDPVESDNEGSMFIKFTAGTAAAIFTGDAGEETELEMATVTNWRADLLKAGHHGSKFSTSFAWLRRVQPKWVVHSCGRSNRYGHPSGEAMARVKMARAENLRTDLMGDIRFRLGPNGWIRAR